MWLQPILANQTAIDDKSQKSFTVDLTIGLKDSFGTAGLSLTHPNVDHFFAWNGGSLYVSGATIVAKEQSKESNVIKLSKQSDIQSILDGISAKPQKGTSLLNFSGVFEGESDMSSNKKKYLDEQ